MVRGWLFVEAFGGKKAEDATAKDADNGDGYI